MRCLSWERFCSAVDFLPDQPSVVIASYKFQDEIFARLVAIRNKLKAIYRPNRKSGMESLFLNIGGEARPIKGLTLDRVV